MDESSEPRSVNGRLDSDLQVSESGADARLDASITGHPAHAHERLSDHHPTQILRKIAAHDERRIEQVYQRLNGNGRAILKALPALLHFNQASLPGYLKGCASGIARYTPSKASLRTMQLLIPTFTPRLARSEMRSLDGLYLMGSAGSIAQTNSSDIDFWICTSKDHVQKLQKKLELLSLWAAQFGIELQGFAVHPEQFNGQPSRSNSYLLLDEFYRSACRMAGKPLRWWLTPSSEPAADLSTKALSTEKIATEHSSSETLATQDGNQFIATSRKTEQRAKEMFVDFGRIKTIPAHDLYAACLHAVQQAFLNPYKGLLKLALLVAYAEGQPLLSEQFKHHALNHQNTADLDVYVVLARYLENYYAHDLIWPVLQTAWYKKVSLHNRSLKDHSAWHTTLQRWQFDPEAHTPQTDAFSNYAQWNQRVMQTIANLYKRIPIPGDICLSDAKEDPLRLRQQALQQIFDYYQLNASEQLPALANHEYKSPFNCVRHPSGVWETHHQGDALAKHGSIIEQLIWWLNNKLDDGIAQARWSGATSLQITQIEHTKRLLKRTSRATAQAFVNIEADYIAPSCSDVLDISLVRLQQFPAPIGQKLIVHRFTQQQHALAFLQANADNWTIQTAHGSGQLGSQQSADAFMQYVNNE